jgi:hypothetical protein
MPDAQPTADAPRKDAPYGMIVVLAGLAAVVLVSLAAMFRFDDATMVVTALGPVTGFIGTLVGAYFGLRGTSLGQQNAAAADVKRAQAESPPPPFDSDGLGPVPAPAPAAG